MQMRIQKRTLAAGLLCLALTSTSLGAQTAAEPKGNPVPSASATESVRKPATDDPNYVIGAQDVLDINVWKEPDLSRAVPVRPDGKISLPLLNDVQAAGLTPSQLAAQITT